MTKSKKRIGGKWITKYKKKLTVIEPKDFLKNNIVNME